MCLLAFRTFVLARERDLLKRFRLLLYGFCMAVVRTSLVACVLLECHVCDRMRCPNVCAGSCVRCWKVRAGSCVCSQIAFACSRVRSQIRSFLLARVRDLTLARVCAAQQQIVSKDR